MRCVCVHSCVCVWVSDINRPTGLERPHSVLGRRVEILWHALGDQRFMTVLWQRRRGQKVLKLAWNFVGVGCPNISGTRHVDLIQLNSLCYVGHWQSCQSKWCIIGRYIYDVSRWRQFTKYRWVAKRTERHQATTQVIRFFSRVSNSVVSLWGISIALV